MIFVDRNAIPPPPQLAEYHERTIEYVRELLQLPHSARAQVRPGDDLPRHVMVETRSRLQQLFQGRCAFCEVRGSSIERFRPRWRASGLDGIIDTLRYLWLANDWRNLYYCCHECNARKANQFPISGSAAAPFAVGNELLDEEPLLLDPCSDDPEHHLSFVAGGPVVPLSERGAATIQIFGLNRPGLVASRSATAKWTEQACEELWKAGDSDHADQSSFLNGVLRLASPDGGHLAVIRAVAKEFFRSHSRTPSPPPAPVEPVPEVEGLPEVVWLDRIEISNFKTIGELDRTFAEPSEGDEQEGQPWLMVLGENSVGKSSLLQAVALALMPDIERAHHRPARVWLSKRTGVSAGYVRLTFTDGSQRELTFKKGKDEFEVKGDVPPIPVLAYGSTRLLPRRGEGKPKGPSLVSVDNLFDHTHPLANVEAYLCDKKKVEESCFNLLATNLKQLLPASGGADITRTTRQMSSELDGRKMSLSELSDGYKSVLALAMDIMFHLTSSSFDMESAQGVVMIDELELHLHPRWKIRIVEQLRMLFPRVRFIASTHDPLCVHGLRKGELHVMAKNPVTRAFMIEQIDVPHGARADEVLTGPWFGLPSTMDAETLELMSEHSALLQWPDRTNEQTRRMEDLETELRERMGSYGNTRAQRAALAVAAMLDHGRPAEQSEQLIRFRLNQVLSGAEPGNGRA